MLTESAFIAYYKEKIYPELVQFEKYRQTQFFEYRTWQIIRYVCLAILILITFLFLAYLAHNSYLSNVFINQIINNDSRIFLLINVIIIFIAIYSKTKMAELSSKFDYASKYQLYEKIVKAYKDFSYYPLSGIDSRVISDSNLFKSFNDFVSEDYIQGKYNNLEIKLSEIELINLSQREELKGNEYVTITESTTVFQGLFIITSMNKAFSATTYVLPNSWLKFLNPLPHYLNRVVLEDPNFEKAFDVYSDNQIEARYLLTPSFMERLQKVNNQYNIRCCFVDNQMLMAIELNHDFFPSLTLIKPITYESIKQIYDQLNIIFLIIDDLKLDMNIRL